MSHLSIVCLLFIMLGSVPFASLAQDDDDTGMPTYTAWQVTRLDEAGNPEEPLDPDAPANKVAILELDEGNTLLFVWAGPDIIYALQNDGTYSGSLLVPSPTYTFTATLEMVDEDTMTSYSVTDTGRFTSETTIVYERTEVEIVIFTELDRTIVEYSQYAECLGRVGDVGRAWTTSDLLVPFQIGEDTLIWSQEVFTGDGATFINEKTQPLGAFENIITQTFIGNAEGFDFSYYAIADGRDDCEMIYESSYVPFDEDFTTLFERAAAETEELEGEE